MLLKYFSLLGCMTINFSAALMQPGCNTTQLPANFSTKPSSWPHGTPPIKQLFKVANSQLARRKSRKFWHGWSSIENIFSFGDSYTSTNFTVTGPQPNRLNPLGNPPYPGATSANGPNYIDFLTATYNRTFIRTFNFAYGGATVNPFLVPTPFGMPVQSFLSQVEKEFLQDSTDGSAYHWEANRSLFTLFFGINDVINSYSLGNDSLNYAVIKSYEGLVNELYLAGARNFLFLNVPPVDRAPISQQMNEEEQLLLAAYIGAFNFRLGALVVNLARRHHDATVFSFDVNSLFLSVLDNPTQFVETVNYRNTIDYCAAYKLGTPTLGFFDPSCGIAVNEYLWLNDLHPTYPVHNFLASQIVQLLDLYG